MAMIEMQVHMCCAGCEEKIRKSLQKLRGVDDIDIDMNLQKVTVIGSVDQKKVLKAARKSGKRAELWQLPYNPELRNHNYHQRPYGGGPGTFHASQPPAASSYNYYKHGYDNHGYVATQSSTIFGSHTGDAFSNENPHGCSIM